MVQVNIDIREIWTQNYFIEITVINVNATYICIYTLNMAGLYSADNR